MNGTGTRWYDEAKTVPQRNRRGDRRLVARRLCRWERQPDGDGRLGAYYSEPEWTALVVLGGQP